jgi:hypothetical protein
VIFVAFQVGLPLLLIAWLAFLPAKSLLAYAFQLLGVGLVLLALGLVALWALPPWWTPWLFAALWLVAVVRHLARSARMSPLWPTGTSWVPLICGLALAAVGGWASVTALAGRSPSPGEIVDIPNPMGPGRYLVAHGGSRELINVHLKTLNPDVPRFADWRGQSYAIDLLAINKLGLRVDGLLPPDPARYVIFGRPVHAPCAGTVTSAENALPDNRVPRMNRDRMLGNHVLLRCGDVELVFAHLRQGTVQVEQGQSVSKGALLGEVGNSGNSSEPHLHIHAQRPSLSDAPAAGEPLALRIDGRYPVRNDVISGHEW